jgi:predicted amidohydrolase
MRFAIITDYYLIFAMLFMQQRGKLKSKPDVLIGTVDMAHLESVKKKYPYLKDRNQDMYVELAERP